MKNKKEQREVIIYQAKDGAIELKGDFKHENIWATQAQIAQAFGVDVRTINEHIKNIYKTEELQEKATIRNFRIVQYVQYLYILKGFIEKNATVQIFYMIRES